MDVLQGETRQSEKNEPMFAFLLGKNKSEWQLTQSEHIVYSSIR